MNKCFACGTCLTDWEAGSHCCSKLRTIREKSRAKVWINTDCRTPNAYYHKKIEIGFAMVDPDNS